MTELEEILEESSPECPCSCHSRHPHQAPPKLHDGGATCSCRLTPEERSQRWQKANDRLQEWWDSPEFKAMKDAEGEGDAAAAEWGGRNGVEFTRLTRMMPEQLEGHVEVDGERIPYYFRERHGSWNVHVPDAGGPSIGAGGEDEYTDTTGILRLVRDAVTKHQRKDCTHPDQGEHQYCPECGRMSER